MAHIIAKSPKGARGNEPVDDDKRNGYENLILLCLDCHKVFDDNPKQYPVEKIIQIKKNHEEKIKQSTTGRTLTSCEQLAATTIKVLDENKTILDKYGPNSPVAKRNPTSNAATLWVRKKAKIIPNNNTIVSLFEINDNLLNNQQRQVFIKFREHAYAFEKNADSKQDPEVVPVFPTEFKDMLIKREP